MQSGFLERLEPEPQISHRSTPTRLLTFVGRESLLHRPTPPVWLECITFLESRLLLFK
jgi:hypothetical protein